MSDEYGAYVYRFTSSGDLIQTIQPPKAILPFQNGALNFTSEVDPTTGRVGNQGTIPDRPHSSFSLLLVRYPRSTDTFRSSPL